MTILVSHCFWTVRMADLIVVLAGCRIVEQGSHGDLIRQGGACAELYRAVAGVSESRLAPAATLPRALPLSRGEKPLGQEASARGT